MALFYLHGKPRVVKIAEMDKESYVREQGRGQGRALDMRGKLQFYKVEVVMVADDEGILSLGTVALKPLTVVKMLNAVSCLFCNKNNGKIIFSPIN